MTHNLASRFETRAPVATLDYDRAAGVFRLETLRESLVAYNLPQAAGMAERAGYRIRLTDAARRATVRA